MFFKGFIYKYDEINNLIAYTNTDISLSLNIILIGGLDHNIISIPYTNSILDFSLQNNIRLIIPQFRSHPNYSIYNIENDIEDLNKLISTIEGDIILIGNSTGCQDIILYCNEFINYKILFCILQAPVSDTEYEESNNFIYKDPSDDILMYNNRIFSKERFISLYKRNNKEDIFSSYLSDTHYINLKINNYKLIFIISKKDEYLININHKFNLVKNSKVFFIEEGDHFLTSKESQKEFLKILSDLIKLDSN